MTNVSCTGNNCRGFIESLARPVPRLNLAGGFNKAFFIVVEDNMKMNEIEITCENRAICISQFNLDRLDSEKVYITIEQAEIVANEISRLVREEE